MPVPWMQIVQLVPSILDVSRELLRKQRNSPPPVALDASDSEMAQRIAQLEENERRQAELINQMAEQIAQLARAATILHQRVIWLTVGLSAALIVAVIALVK